MVHSDATETDTQFVKKHQKVQSRAQKPQLLTSVVNQLNLVYTVCRLASSIEVFLCVNFICISHFLQTSSVFLHPFLPP
jgi:hypothetical protein